MVHQPRNNVVEFWDLFRSASLRTMENLGLHEQTSLWIRTLAAQKDDIDQAARSRLRNAYEALRRNVTQLAAQITKDLPQATLHDVHHLDALWTTADLIAGPEFLMTPTEAFVFGAAVLLHDAGHALAAVQGGLSTLKQTSEWRDAAVAALENAGHSPITQTTINNPPQKLFNDILFSVLRALHGSNAEKLALIEFKNEMLLRLISRELQIFFLHY